MSLGYDKRVRPNYGGPPVQVNVTMRIISISSVSEVMMDFTGDFYFRQTWHDPRLAFKKLNNIGKLYVGAEVSKKIWLPDTFFGNEKMVSAERRPPSSPPGGADLAPGEQKRSNKPFEPNETRPTSTRPPLRTCSSASTTLAKCTDR